MRSIYACLLFATAMPAAHAAFYVSDATPATPVVVTTPLTSREAAQADDPAVHKIPFAARSTQLSWAAKRAMQRILPVAQSGTQVVISGCGEGSASDVTAYRRAAEIKAWLLANGIADDAVKVRTGADASTVRAGGAYQCLVSFNEAAPASATIPAPPKPATIATAAPAQPSAAATVAPRPATASAADPRIWMVQSVLDMVAAKTLRAEDAIAMLDRIIKTGPGAPAQAPAAAPPPVQPIMQPAIAAPALQVVPVPPSEWTLKSGSTLQATLEEWSRQAGWKPPVWRAANPYQVATGGTLRGDYLDALRQLSKAVPQIDITVSPDGRSLIVSDAKPTL